MVDLGVFLRHLFSPETLSAVLAVGSVAYKVFKAQATKDAEERRKAQACQDEAFEKVKQQISEFKKESQDQYGDVQKEILRLQILEGIDAHRLSESEVRYFYDKYRAFGGNSFVTAKVHAYLESLEEAYDDQESR